MPAGARRHEPVVSHRGGIGSVLRPHDIGAGACRPGLELLGGGGAESVRGHQQARAPGAREARRQLSRERGLPHAVDARHERHPRALLAGLEPTPMLPEHLGRALLQRRAQIQVLAPHPLARARDQTLGGGGSNVGGEQRLLELFERRGIHRAAPPQQAADRFADPRAGALEPATKPFPQIHRALRHELPPAVAGGSLARADSTERRPWSAHPPPPDSLRWRGYRSAPRPASRRRVPAW